MRVLVFFLVFAALPVLGALIRLFDVFFVAATAATERFHDAPVPIILHASGAALFLLLAAVQVSPRLRKNFPRWHRRAGKVALVSGVIAALAGVWTTLTYPNGVANPELLVGFRVIFGLFWALCLIDAGLAIRTRERKRHAAGMIRAVAIASGAGTSALLFGALAIAGWLEDTAEINTAVQAGAWMLNLAIAEVIIRAQSQSSSARRAVG